MADLPKEPIFFRDEHRAFLETRDADVLDWGVMRLNLYRLKTGNILGSYWASWPAIIIFGAVGIVCGGVGIVLLFALGREGVEYIAQHGVPHWRLIVYVLIKYGWFGAIVGIATLVSWAMLNTARKMLLWPDQRITRLLSTIALEGQLIEGSVTEMKYNDRFKWEASYHFTNPIGQEIDCVFLPGNYQQHAPGTPVWVLYLNDKISVLL